MRKSSWDSFLGVKPGPQRESGSSEEPVLSNSAGIARYAGAAQRYAKASKAHHPAQPIRLVPAPAGTVTQAAFYTRTLANAMSLTWMSVQPSTLETYGNGWRQWVKWLECAVQH